ncbi:hypothetical protein D9M72_508080 [compost metagenome]
MTSSNSSWAQTAHIDLATSLSQSGGLSQPGRARGRFSSWRIPELDFVRGRSSMLGSSAMQTPMKNPLSAARTTDLLTANVTAATIAPDPANHLANLIAPKTGSTAAPHEGQVFSFIPRWPCHSGEKTPMTLEHWLHFMRKPGCSRRRSDGSSFLKSEGEFECRVLAGFCRS